jgi:threonine dehydrogenase-like Zn-dependent dehydrogenase
VRAVVIGSDGLPSSADLPEPAGPGARVAVRACGLCGSDVEKLGVAVSSAVPGTVLGHELEGALDDGTRVTVAHRVACGACARCEAGHESTCVEFATSRIDPGGFAERLHATHAIALPDSVGALDGVWVEPLACVLRAAPLVPRGRVLVAGCGAVGLLWVDVLLRRGDEVAAADPRPDRLAFAAARGAGTAAGPVSAAVVTAAAGLGDALALLEPGGTALVFSAPAEPAPVHLDAVYRKELTLVGSRSATLAAFAEAIELLPLLRLPPVTRLPLERFAEGLGLYRRGDTYKVVFTP